LNRLLERDSSAGGGAGVEEDCAVACEGAGLETTAGEARPEGVGSAGGFGVVVEGDPVRPCE